MNYDLLAKVCETPSIPGFEDAAQDVVQGILADACDEVTRDRMGNVIGLKRATNPPDDRDRPLKVVLAAHVDEIGMLVKRIDGDGFIGIEPVGGLNPQATVGQRVVIHSRVPINGVIVPRKLGSPLPELHEILIDVGMHVDDVRSAVEIGDVVTFSQELSRLNENVYTGRNFDDRIGTYCLLEAMAKVGRTSVDTYAVSTVQEELGVRGMPPAAFAIEPDVGVALDGSVTRGAHMAEHEATCEMGAGTGIYVMDRLTVGHPKLVRFLIDLCESEGIRYQRNIGGGTDASAIQRSRSGAWATTIGAPVRYMHSTVQLVHEDDIDATVQLLVTFLENAHKLDIPA